MLVIQSSYGSGSLLSIFPYLRGSVTARQLLAANSVIVSSDPKAPGIVVVVGNRRYLPQEHQVEQALRSLDYLIQNGMADLDHETSNSQLYTLLAGPRCPKCEARGWAIPVGDSTFHCLSCGVYIKMELDS